MSDPSLFLSLLVTVFTLYGLAALLACYLRPRYAEDDAGSGRWLPR